MKQNTNIDTNDKIKEEIDIFFLASTGFTYKEWCIEALKNEAW